MNLMVTKIVIASNAYTLSTLSLQRTDTRA
jgi:hypothetical protein